MRYACNMKSSQWILFLVVMLSCAACRRDKAVEVVEPETPPAAAAAKADIPTDAEVAAFVAEWKDPSDADKSIRFDVTFGVPPFMPHIMNEFRERGKIPFTVSVNFYRLEADSDSWRRMNVYSIMDGQAEIAILDADGRVVDRTRKDLALLCPS